MSVSIQINKGDIDRIKRDFKLMSDEVPVVQARVINRTLTAVNTEGSVQVRKEYNLKAARVKKNFKISKATKNNLSGSWRSEGRPVGLRNFESKQAKKGISVKVLKSGARMVVVGTFIRIPASPRVRKTGEQMYWRGMHNGVIVGRDPIHRLDGPRIEDALAKPEAQKALQKKADETMQKRLDVEANYILSKAGK